MNLRFTGAGLLFGAALLGATTTSALAQTSASPQAQGASFSIAPAPDQDFNKPKNAARDHVPASLSWFTFHANPGEQIRDSVRIQNSGQVPADLFIYAVDAATGTNSGMVMQNRDSARSGVGGW